MDKAKFFAMVRSGLFAGVYRRSATLSKASCVVPPFLERS